MHMIGCWIRSKCSDIYFKSITLFLDVKYESTQDAEFGINFKLIYYHDIVATFEHFNSNNHILWLPNFKSLPSTTIVDKIFYNFARF